MNTNNAIVALHQATCLGCTSLSTLESHFVNRTYTSAFLHSYYGSLLSPPNLSSGLAGRRSQVAPTAHPPQSSPLHPPQLLDLGYSSLLTLHLQPVPPNIAASASHWLRSHCAGISFLLPLQLLIPISSISFPPACLGVRCHTLGRQFVISFPPACSGVRRHTLGCQFVTA